MSRILPILAITALLFSSACSRNNSPEPTTPNTIPQSTLPNLIAGKWKVHFNADDMNGNHLPDEDEKEFATTPMFITFNVDGTGKLEEPGEPSRQMNWLVNGKTISIQVESEPGVLEDPESYHVTSISAIDMLWQDSADSASFFVGFVK